MALSREGARGLDETRERILDVAVEVLGKDPQAGMGEVAAAANVVRRTVYGYYPSRSDLLSALAQRAGHQVASLVRHASGDAAEDVEADVAWAGFVDRLWPLVHRYRVLVALRRGEHGQEIHAALVHVEGALAALVEQGQAAGVFGRHLPAGVLGQAAWSTVFTLADTSLMREQCDAVTATVASLLILGVPLPRAQVLAERARTAVPTGPTGLPEASGPA